MIKNFFELSEEDEMRLEFYKQFIVAGDLVFDVGANVGNRSKVFAKLGAKVVAVEPNKRCAEFLDDVFEHSPDFHVINKALGSNEGTARMLICSAHTISSLSQDWVQAVKGSGRFAEFSWDQSEIVAVTTLDSLIDEFGTPSFIKVDVEGFEYPVVSGLTRKVNAISLEFVPEFLDDTIRCIHALQEIVDFEYQISLGESMRFALGEWVTCDLACTELKKIAPSMFGDLYARPRII